MLTKVCVRNFKNIEEATLELRQTNLLTGAGGSGKTNLIEAISILGDLARGLNADAALTAAVRGGAEAAKGPGSDFGRTTIEIGAAGRLGNPNEKPDATPSTTDWELDISIDPAARRLTGERLKTCAPYAADAAGGRQGNPAAGMGYERREGAEKGMAGIARLANGWTLGPAYEPGMLGKFTQHALIARAICDELSRIQVLNLDERAMREPCRRRNGRRLERDGANIASVIEEILRTEDGRAVMKRWLHEYSSCGCREVRVTATGEEKSEKLELSAEIDGRELPALLWGTGLLHFIGTVAAVFQKDPAGLLILDPLDQGMDSQSMGQLYHLLHAARESRSRSILATIRNLRILHWGHDEDREQIFVAKQALDESTARMLSIEDLAAERNMNVPDRGSLSELLAQGWANS